MIYYYSCTAENCNGSLMTDIEQGWTCGFCGAPYKLTGKYGYGAKIEGKTGEEEPDGAPEEQAASFNGSPAAGAGGYDGAG